MWGDLGLQSPAPATAAVSGGDEQCGASSRLQGELGWRRAPLNGRLLLELPEKVHIDAKIHVAGG